MKKLFYLAALAALVACGGSKSTAEGPQLLNAEDFRTTLNGKEVYLFTLQNDNGMAVQLTNYGARIVSLWVPARDGQTLDVTHGYETIEGYLNTTDKNSGPVVGRYGNRIDKGRFTLDGVEYELEQNDKGNHLHGGATGFAFQVWEGKETKTESGDPAVEFSYRSPDGEGEYPGNLDIVVRYSLTADNRLVLDYEAVTDAPTILNPTSHAYFNLHGTAEKAITSHELMLNSSAFTATDEGLIPTGEIVNVEGTPLDFRTPTAIGERIGDEYEALEFGGGYDHNFILDTGGDTDRLAAEVYEPATGVVMKVYTDQPAIQVYSGNFMNGTNIGKGGVAYSYRTGLALEAQNYPDAPNHGHFPSPVLRPGEVYSQKTIYAFEVR